MKPARHRKRAATLTVCAWALYTGLAIALNPGQARAQPNDARLKHVYGYLQDKSPTTDRILLVWSKAHQTTYRVLPQPSCLYREHGHTIPRSFLYKGAYVIASGHWKGATFTAIRISIVIRHKHHRKATL